MRGGGLLKSANTRSQSRSGLCSSLFASLDDFVGDYRDDRVCSIRKMQGRARHFECDPHDALDLGVDVLAVQVWSNGHAALPGLWRVIAKYYALSGNSLSPESNSLRAGGRGFTID